MFSCPALARRYLLALRESLSVLRGGSLLSYVSTAPFLCEVYSRYCARRFS
ncbi:MAG: hypothetical protein QHG98_05005 [Methanothrix sp.]|uniref:hypothetical protein n=1 Tax=Methanothrix sp. TaxID=90426 RepID=UPI00247C203D|nr:hypothetical protein [Methanothrix sp.]